MIGGITSDIISTSVTNRCYRAGSACIRACVTKDTGLIVTRKTSANVVGVDGSTRYTAGADSGGGLGTGLT